VVLTNGSGVAAQLTYGVVFRLFELLFDQPASFDAFLTSRLDGLAAARDALLAQLGAVDPATVAPFLGRYTNPDLGEMQLTMRGDKLYFRAAANLSQVRPRLADDGTVDGYILVDPTLGGFPPQATLTLSQSEDGRPRIVMTALADSGDPDLVYDFDQVASMATPAP